MQNMIRLTNFVQIRILNTQNMYFDPKQHSTLYYSSVKQTRPSSAIAYQKRTSFEWKNDQKPPNFAPPSYLNTNKKQEYKFNGFVSSIQRSNQEASKYKVEYSTTNDMNDKTYQSKSAKKHENASIHQNIASHTTRNNEGQFDPKQFTPTRSRRSSDTINLNHIMQKIQKKEQLIKELQKICDNKVSDSIRKSSEDKQKSQEVGAANSKKFSPAHLKVEKSPTSQGYKTSLEIIESPIMNLNFSNVSSIKSKRDTNFSYLKEFSPLTVPQRKQSSGSNSNKNPEQNIVNLQRMQYSNSPRDYNGNLKNKQKLKMHVGKVASNLDIPYQDQNYEKYTSKSSNYNFTDINALIIDKKKETQMNYKERKNTRIMIQNRIIGKNSTYFSNKKVSISDFLLKKILGEGKFGKVYQAFHLQTNTLYALKKISKKVIKSNLMVQQLLQEIKIQFYCSQQNILKIYGFFDDSDFIYLILEYMEEGTLFSSLKKQKTLSQKEAAIKIKDTAKAIVYLQQNGIVHRDIKPENIVMSYGVCKLCDFGWAAICIDRRKTYCGTVDYVAPEILEGNEYDITVDLWCLGVMAYELMVGKAPFYHISRKQTMKKIMNVQKRTLEFPAHLSKNAISFIESLIKKNPQQRLQGDSIMKHPFLSFHQQNIY